MSKKVDKKTKKTKKRVVKKGIRIGVRVTGSVIIDPTHLPRCSKGQKDEWHDEECYRYKQELFLQDGLLLCHASCGENYALCRVEDIPTLVEGLNALFAAAENSK